MKYCFLGNMNNMAFVFARQMIQEGFDVTLFVDAEKDNMLDRPESMDSSLGDPYPIWIRELSPIQKAIIKKPFLLGLRKNTYLSLLKSFDVIILNGTWIRLGKYLPRTKKLIVLFAGYDLEVLADYNSIPASLTGKGILQTLKRRKYRAVISQQRAGIRRADAVNYFPEGINPAGDKLISQIKTDGTYKRLQLRGFPFHDTPFSPLKDDGGFHILNFTRFFFSDHSRNDNKRNDIMIRGVADFIRSNKLSTKDVRITFFDKGPDATAARKICAEQQLSPFITWKKQVSQLELNRLIEDADVVFDQLGNQWLGYGIVAMAAGRPLIANGRPDVFDKLTGEPSPVCNATSEKEVCNWLTLLYLDKNKSGEIGRRSSEYILKHYDIRKTTAFITSV